jgi:hypothetical protein
MGSAGGESQGRPGLVLARSTGRPQPGLDWVPELGKKTGCTSSGQGRGRHGVPTPACSGEEARREMQGTRA